MQHWNFLLEALAPDHMANLAARYPDIGQEPVVERFKLALGPCAVHITDHAARDPAEIVRDQAQREAAVCAATVDRCGSHGHLLNLHGHCSCHPAVSPLSGWFG